MQKQLYIHMNNVPLITEAYKVTGIAPMNKEIVQRSQAHSMPHRKFTNLVYLIQLALLFRFQSAIGLATCRETGVGHKVKREEGQEKKGRGGHAQQHYTERHTFL